MRKPFIILRSVLFALLFFQVGDLISQDLARKGVPGFRAQFQSTDPRGAKVTSVIQGSPADKAGLKKDDVIVSFGEKQMTDAIEFERKISVVKGGQRLQVKVNRDGRVEDISFVIAAAPLEKNINKTEYGVVDAGSYRLRTITTVPARSANVKLPAVLFIQWLSCGSIEYQSRARNGVDSLVRSFANSTSVVFMRVDRPGSGDSEGGPCVDCGLTEELDAYRRALESLRNRPDVDPNKIFILGLSLGGSLAPVVGAGQNIAGYMVSGACTQTWFEHMLDIERRQLKLSGASPSEENAAIKKFTKFYERYYIEKMTPAEVVKSNPELAGLWQDDPAHQYQRPARFFQEVQALDFEGAWEKVNVPVLIVFGTFDWIMSERDHSRIAEIVNSNKPGLARLEVMKGVGHSLDKYPSLQDAFNGTNRVVDAGATPIFMSWLEGQIRK